MILCKNYFTILLLSLCAWTPIRPILQHVGIWNFRFPSTKDNSILKSFVNGLSLNSVQSTKNPLLRLKFKVFHEPCNHAVRPYMYMWAPGLFKKEISGTGIIALNSKTYHSFKASTSKTSTKGIMCNLNSFNKAHFLGTLTTKKPVFGTNKGFMRKNNPMVTYTQLKSGLAFFYAKRLVCDYGVSK